MRKNLNMQTLWWWLIATIYVAVAADDYETCAISTIEELKPKIQDVLTYHDDDAWFDHDSKNNLKDTLGYVTPWNNRGYDFAKKYALKFTMICPVWYQIRTDVNTGLPVITGTHDVDNAWIHDIRKKNPDILIVPRFAFEMNSLTQVESETIVRLIIDELLARKHDGLVIEIPVIAPTISFLSSLGARLNVLKKKLIIVLSPAAVLDRNGASVAIKQLLQLVKVVYRISVNMYDYPVATGTTLLKSSNAPIYWGERLHKVFIDHDAEDVIPKLLYGIPFYGYKRVRSPKVDSVAVIGHEYLSILKESDNDELKWDSSAKESYYENYDQVMRVYYPNLAFLSSRIDFVSENEMAGVAIWELGQGLEYFFKVL